jgi:uncharacterized protein
LPAGGGGAGRSGGLPAGGGGAGRSGGLPAGGGGAGRSGGLPAGGGGAGRSGGLPAGGGGAGRSGGLPADEGSAGGGAAGSGLARAGGPPAGDAAGGDATGAGGAGDLARRSRRAARRGDGEDAGPVAGATASAWERAVVRAQLGRPPRAMRAVAAWCPCGLPDVVETAPRLADGAPFPTLFYLTCPRAASAIGRLEAGGVMRSMTERLGTDAELAGRYRAAHEAYLRRRDEIEPVPEIDGVSAGGMPTRVKCLHVLVGHALAAGRGVNPLGDEALDLLPDWWADGPCVAVDGDPAGSAAAGDAAGAGVPAGAADVDGRRSGVDTLESHVDGSG